MSGSGTATFGNVVCDTLTADAIRPIAVNAITTTATITGSSPNVAIVTATAGYDITMPAASAVPGATYKFIAGGAAAIGFIVNVACGANTSAGILVRAGVAVAAFGGSNHTSTGARFAATAIPGDQIIATSDGSKWNFLCYSGVADGVAGY